MESLDSLDEYKCMKRPSLLGYLKHILEQYPNTSVLKEMIQNAEDARATEFKILVYKEKLENESFDCDESKYFEPPGIFLYNDAFFSEKDWRGISSIYNSVKRDDFSTVGKFGLGFKSVFHLTDFAIIISGDRLMVIDPFQSDGREIHIVNLQKYIDKFWLRSMQKIKNGFSVFGFNSATNYFSGTLFWFPLRQKPSELCIEVFPGNTVEQLLKSFIKEADMYLLFLLFVKRIIVLNHDSKDQLYEVCMHSDESNSHGLSVAEYTEHLKTLGPHLPQDSLLCVNVLQCECRHKGQTQKDKWYVSHFFKGTQHCSDPLFTLSQVLTNSPCGGVAARLTTNVLKGHTFCFLPLPVNSLNCTGLPVHVNGFFALSTDRDHVKWAQERQSCRTLEQSQLWNTALIEDVIIPSYVAIILAMCRDHVDSSYVYSLIPVENENTTWNWKQFIFKLHQVLFEENIFYTKNNGGSWVHRNHNKTTFNIFLETEDKSSFSKGFEQSILKVISCYDVNLVELPEQLKTLVYNFDSSVRCITWQHVLSLLHGKETKFGGYKNLAPDVKEDLLFYLLIRKDLQMLTGLCLLPLNNGNYVTLQQNLSCSKENFIWLCTQEENELFPVLEEDIVADLKSPTFRALNELLDGNWNVKRLTPENFCQILKGSLNKCTRKETDTFGRVFFTPDNSVILTSKWVLHVWSFLSKHGIIEKCADIPLIPLDWNDKAKKENQLHQLIPLQGNVLFDFFNYFNKNFVKCLEILSIFVIKCAPGLIENYILANNNNLVVKFFEQMEHVHLILNTRDILVNFNSTIDEQKKEFAKFLAKNMDFIPLSLLGFFRELELFPSGKLSERKADTLSSISCVNAYITFQNFPVPLPYKMLLLWEQNYQHLAKKFGAVYYSLNKLMLETLSVLTKEPKTYSKSNSNILMKFFMKNISKWDENCLNMAKRIPFLEAKNGEQKKPNELFVSTSKLQLLFYYHPSKIVREGYDKYALKLLEVKDEKCLTFEDLLLISKHISVSLEKQNIQAKVCHISHAVLDALEKSCSQDTHLEKFFDIKFISHQYLRQPEFPNALPWYGNQHKFSSPREVKSLQLFSFLGSACCLIGDSSLTKISKFYQWNHIDNPELLINQILIIKENWSIRQKSELSAILNKVYRHIFSSDNIDLICLCKIFEDRELLFDGSKFFPPSRILLEMNDLELEPFIGVLTDEFSEYHDKLKVLGCMETLSVERCKEVIQEMECYHKENNKLEKKTIIKNRNSVIKLLQYVLDKKETNTISDILVPIRSDKLILKPAKECTVFSMKNRVFLKRKDPNSNFVHEDVPSNICKGFGIPTFAQRLMARGNAEDLVMNFGQQESLTTRLNSILDGYKDGVAVFKELVQNADDAGATKIMFMYDERENEEYKQTLISSGMAECQGPALWSFNDALFSKEDFNNITKLSGKTKLSDNSKIGKFGLGFCAVYNITDVPSIFSGNSLIFFDPHIEYLEEAITDPRNPGVSIEFNGDTLTKDFPDQFRPYQDVFKCNIFYEKPYFNGTLFRLPLRTQKQCKKSQIKKKEYNKYEMKKLIHMFISMAGNILLFTPNIQKISFFHLLDGKLPCDAINIFTAVKTNTSSYIEHPIQQTASILKNLSLSHTAEDALWIEHVMLHIITDFSWEGKVIVQKNITNWMISWYAETKEMKKVLDDFSREGQKALPLGAVAVLKENGMAKSLNDQIPFGLYNKGHIFCFLPLPEEYNIPVHINGCLEVNIERTTMVNRTGEEMEPIQNDWNLSLFKTAVCRAYINALVEFIRGKNQHENYSEIWLKEANTVQMQELMKSFYQTIVTEDIPVFYQSQNDKTAYSYKRCIFLSQDLAQSCVGEIALKIFYSFENSRGIPMKLPLDIYNCLLKNVDSDKIFDRIVTEEDFFIDIFLPNIEGIDQTFRDDLILYAIKSENATILSHLKNCSCIPTHPKGRLRKPSEIIVNRNNSYVTKLFSKNDERFTQKPFSESFITTILLDLGAILDELPLDLIIERAGTVRTMPYTKACKRSALILAYLKMVSYNEQLYKKIANVPFISVINCPPTWPLEWPVNNKNAFQMPVEVYHSDCLRLCGCSKKIINIENYRNCHELESIFEQLCVQNVKDVSVDDVIIQINAIDKLVAKPDFQKTDYDFILGSMEPIVKFFSRLELSENVTALQEILRHKRFLCVQHTIFCPDNLTLEEIPFNCSPALCSMNTKYDSYEADLKKGLILIGVSESITLNQIKHGLQLMTEKGASALEKQEVEVYINLVRLYRDKFSEAGKICLCLPNVLGELKPCSSLFYADVERVTQEKHSLVHPSVPLDLLKFFDIPSYSQKTLNRMSLFLPFGQKEELVVRLHNLVKEYTLNCTLFNELIQNAEDAGATEVHFVLDKRYHSTEGIFDKKYAEVQGPALCVYNDSCFTEKDLIGIQNLGSGSKANDANKIGQFGLGFNVVYNITDIPSFLTIGDSVPDGGTFCVFDPLFSFCACNNYDRPGLRLPGINILKENFPGVYECFLQGKDELPHMVGSWFRFPLRTKTMAAKSKIKNEEITIEKMEELIQNFEKEVHLSLIFLRSVRKITFSIIDEKCGLKTTAETKSSIHSLHAEVKKYHEIANNVNNVCNISKIHELCYPLHIEGPKKQLWLISSIYGHGFGNQLTSELRNYIQGGLIELPPDCSVAVLLHSSEPCLSGKLFCSLPLPCNTRLPVHINGRFALTSNRLSLFADEKNQYGNYQRTQNSLWNDYLLQSLVAKAYLNSIEWIKSKWNGYNSKIILFYFSLFPLAHGTCKDSVIEKVANGFYQLVLENKPLIWPLENDGEIDWVSLQGTHELDKIFVDNITEFYLQSQQSKLDIIQRRMYINLSQKEKAIQDFTDKHKKSADCLRKQLKAMGLKLICLPSEILDSINHSLKSIYSVQHISPKTVLQFLKNCVTLPGKEHGSPVNETCFQTSDILCQVFYYVKAEIKHVSDLQDLPLCLTQDGKVHVFGSTPCLVSKFYSLLPGSNKKFVHESLIEMLPCYTNSNLVVQTLDLPTFKKYFPHSFNVNKMRGSGAIKFEQGENMPRLNWYKKFWKFIQVEKISIDLVKKELNEWRVIVGHSKNEIFLVPVICGNFLCQRFDKNEYLHLQTLAECLLQIDLPIGSPVVPSELIAAYDRPESVLEYLHFQKNNLNNISKGLSVKILNYITENIKFESLDDEKIQKFQELPLFFIRGKAFPMFYFKKMCILDFHNIPFYGLEYFSLVTKTAIMHNLHLSESCLQHFNIKVIKSVEYFYIDLLEDLVRYLKIEDIQKHFDFLVESNLFRVQPLNKALKHMKLVRNGQTCLKASNYFDSTLEICEKLCESSELLPGLFNNESHLELMRQAGLQIIVPISKFTDFAIKISRLDSSDKKTQELSEILFSYLQNTITINRLKYLKEIKDIKCIIKHKIDGIYHDICQQRACAGQICYSEAVFYRELEFVWSLLPVLPKYACFYESTFSFKPTLSSVCSHIGNVCSNLSKYENKITEYKDHICKLMNKFYDYLSDKDISEIKPFLQYTPLLFIKSKNMLVNACQASLDEDAVLELSPYLVEVPHEYRKFLNLFEGLGATISISLKQLVYVLNKIANYTKQTNKFLIPKEKECIFKAYENFWTLICEKKYDFKKEFKDVQELFLLSSKGKLHKSNELFFGDILDWPDRLSNEPVFNFLKHSTEMPKDLWDVFECFSPNIKPKFLLDAVEERIEKLTPSTVHCENIIKLKSILQCERFLAIMEAVYKNLKHDEKWQQIASNFKHLSIVGVENIITVLYFENKKLEKTVKSKHIFLEFKKVTHLTLYLKEDDHTFDLWLHSIQNDLIFMLQNCTFNIDESNLQKIVENLHSMDLLEALFMKKASAKDPFKDYLGSYVPKDLYDMLIRNFKAFEKGEIVAMEVFFSEGEDPLYIFVQIVDCENEEEDLCNQTFVVDTGVCLESKYFLELYRFVRNREEKFSLDVELFAEGLEKLEINKLTKFQKNVLKMLRSLPKKKRQKYIMEQVQYWHPDNNSIKKILCEEMTKFLLKIRRILKDGKLEDLLDKLDDLDCFFGYDYNSEDEEIIAAFSSVPSNIQSQHVVIPVNQHGNVERRQQCNVPNPVPMEAHRYMKQAKLDYRLAQYLFDQEDCPPCHNWILYLCHQACEKSIKSYGWSIDERKMDKKSHNLRGILFCTPDFILDRIPEIFSHIGNYNGLRYPDIMKLPCIPQEVFCKEDSKTVLSATNNLLSTLDGVLP